MSQDSLFRIPPTPAEQALIHQFFVKSIDLKVAFLNLIPVKLGTIMHMYGRYRNRAMDTFYNFINKNIFYEFSTSFRSLHCSFKEAINSMHWCSLFFMPFLIGLRASLFP
jgi:hypothetical protein